MWRIHFVIFEIFALLVPRDYYHILVEQMSAEQRDNDSFILLVIFLFEVVSLNYTKLEQVHTYFISTLCPFTSLKSTA